MIDLICGGVSSGKSKFALELASQYSNEVSFVATGFAADNEMASKIRKHKEERPDHWQLIEEKINLIDAICKSVHEVVLIDSLSFWIFNVLEDGWDLSKAKDYLNNALFFIPHKKIILVSDEVGLGGIATNSLTRRFSQLNGECNQLIGSLCNNLYFVVSGQSIRVKGSSM